MQNPDVLFDEETLKRGAEIVRETNKLVAQLIDINAAARTTCTKPSGNASVILGTESGIHGGHSPRYFRNVQMTNIDDVAQLITEVNPKMVEVSAWNTSGTDLVVSFPIVSGKGTRYKADLMGVKQLEAVKFAQQHWVENGTNVELCTDPKLRHNISNTISVDNWDEVEEYIYQNREWFAGISLLAAAGDKAYVQAPFTEVLTQEDIMQKYGAASMFASGLIVDGNHAFNNNLWLACDSAMSYGARLTPTLHVAVDFNDAAARLALDAVEDLLQRDWIRRFHKFAINYFNGDLLQTSFCLKDVYNLHKWEGIVRTMKDIDFSSELSEQKFVDVDTMGSQACSGNQCEVSF